MLHVLADNVAALTLLCKMQPHSERLGLIAREIALDVANSAFSPDDVSHIPGISNKGPDILSRMYESRHVLSDVVPEVSA